MDKCVFILNWIAGIIDYDQFFFINSLINMSNTTFWSKIQRIINVSYSKIFIEIILFSQLN